MLADEKTVTVLDGEAHFIADHEIEVKLPNGKKLSIKETVFSLILVQFQ